MTISGTVEYDASTFNEIQKAVMKVGNVTEAHNGYMERLCTHWLEKNADGCYFRSLGTMDLMRLIVNNTEEPRLISIDELHRRNLQNIDLLEESVNESRRDQQTRISRPKVHSRLRNTMRSSRHYR